MTVREMFIKLGFTLDEASEQKAQSNIEKLKSSADELLGSLSVGFEQSGFGEVVENFSLIQEEIGNTVTETENLQKAQEELVETSEAVAESAEKITDTYVELSEHGAEIYEIVKEGEKWVDVNGELVDSLDEAVESHKKLNDSVEETTKSNEKLKESAKEVQESYEKLADSVPAELPVKYEVDKGSESKAQASIKGLYSLATGLLGAIGIGFSLTSINTLMEEFGAVNTQISSAVSGSTDLAQAQDKILSSANDLRASYEDTANSVSTLVSSSPDLFSLDEAIAYNEATTKLFKSSGKSNEEIASLMENINKSFQKGYVDSGTITALLEQSPEAVALLNQTLGTTSDQL